MRTFGFLVVSILLLPRLIGVNGVWLSVPAAEFLTVFVSAGFIWCKKGVYHYAGGHKKQPAAGLSGDNI